MPNWWTDFLGWMTRDPAWLVALEVNGLSLAIAVIIALILLPHWVGRVARAQWQPMRTALVAAALDAHRDCNANLAALSWQLIGDNPASPLERLVEARHAIEGQHASGQRLGRMLAIYGSGVDARHAALLAETATLLECAESTLVELTRTYLEQATVRIGANSVHADDYLGYEPSQLVSLDFSERMERAIAKFGEAAARHRARIEPLLGRKGRKAAREDLNQAASDVAEIAAEVRSFCARLQPMDPGCTTYKLRSRGERVQRTLDTLIARFDRRG